MVNIFSNKKTLKAGFTLIELLVVVAIIGILASIVLASLNTARQRSRDARRVADIKQIQLALELYFDSCGEYPDNYNTAAAACNSVGTGLVGNFLQGAPVDPTTQAVYPYNNFNGLATPFVECAVDGSAGTGNCIYYHIGVTLEEAGVQALRSDRDRDGAVGTGPDGVSSAVACGADAANTTVNDPDDRCYDATP